MTKKEEVIVKWDRRTGCVMTVTLEVPPGTVMTDRLCGWA